MLVAIPMFGQVVTPDWDEDFKVSNDSVFKEFDDFVRQATNEFEDFRRQINEEFSNFLAEAWKPMPTQPAEEPPEKPKPIAPVIAPSQQPRTIQLPNGSQDLRDADRPDLPVSPDLPPEQLESVQIPFSGKFISPTTIVHPTPIEGIKVKPRPNDPVTTLRFFDTPLTFHLDKSKSPKLKDATERSVADMWKQLADPYYDNIIAECLANAKWLNLCDWGYVLLTKQVAEAYCGKNTNEAVVMQMYLLTQSGYQVRIGRAENSKFSLLLGSKAAIYKYKFFTMGSERFYILDRSLQDQPFFVFSHAFPQEKSLSLDIAQPKLTVAQTTERQVASKRYPNVKAVIETNQNLIDFYDTYPLNSEWNTYSRASLSDLVKEELYPLLRETIKDKSETAAVNILLNFVQTAFPYKNDRDQFGYERPLFPDETFYYPYCDCEDRSILFACFVRELLGLDVVLLHYPGHLATAVRFAGEVEGDHLYVDGKKYLVCDPTYIGAELGRCMPQYKATDPTVQTF